MQTQARHHGLWGLLCVVLGVIWLTWGVAPLEALSAWGARFASWGSCMFMGLYSVAPAFQGAAPHMTGKLFCTAILGMILLLMGTTVGGMHLSVHRASLQMGSRPSRNGMTGTTFV